MRSVAGVVVLLLTCGCADLWPTPNAPKAHDGVLDLSSWNFDRDGPLPLDGTWDLLWNTLPDPNGNDDATTRSATGHAPVPGQWDVLGVPGLGAATYRLRVKLPHDATPLSLEKTHADSAYVLYADVARDGQRSRTLVAQSGRPSLNAADEVPACIFRIADLPSAGDDDEIVLLSGVSNFIYPRGGEGGTTTIGTRAQMEELRDARRERDFFLAGFILVVGLYHLALFALRRSEKAPLWFGLFCVVMATRAVERGRHLEDLFAGHDLFLTAKRIEYFGFYLAVPLFVAYLDALLDHAMNRFVRRAVYVLYGGLSVIVVTTSPLVFGRTPPIAQLAALAMIGWSIFEIVRFIRRTGDRTLLVVLLGFVALGGTVVLDMMSNLALLPFPVLTPIGQGVFVLAQASVLATANARARKTAEDLTKETLRLSKLKDEFLANTSHELRTPLNAIINIPHGLLAQIEERAAVVCSSCGAQFEASDDADDGGDVEGTACPSCGEATLARSSVRTFNDDGDALAAHLRSIIGSGEQLLAVVNDILDLSKLSAGQLELHRDDLDVADVVKRSVDVVAPLAKTADVAIVVTVEPGLRLHADRVRITQVIVNLVGNAVKFSPPHAVVDVEARSERGAVVVRVVDRGVGIAPEHHALIFESFRQVEAGHTRKHGGTGLGLSIVKQLVELHGGTVRVESALGKGATFIVELPNAPPSPRA